MAVPFIQPAFSSGELAPSLFGRIDLTKVHSGCSTLRNFFVSYRGGATSRAGTRYVCRSAQAYGTPPRLIKFQFSITQGYALEFGDKYVRFIFQGALVTEAPKSIVSVTIATPGVLTVTANGYSVGDQVFITGMTGMTELNGGTFIVGAVTTNTIDLLDLNGNVISTAGFPAYTGGGTIARIYKIASPYAAADLPALKFTQSADVMSIAHPSYPPYDLERLGATNWQFVQTSFGSTISPPASITAAATVTTGSNPTSYAYQVTAVDGVSGDESVASAEADVVNSVDIGSTAGSIQITWVPVTGAQIYNLYKAPTAYANGGKPVPAGSLFGFLGSSYGQNFVDSNITPDVTQVPPLHKNPFAKNAVVNINIVTAGTGIVGLTPVITTLTGSGFAGYGVLNASGALLNFVITNGGQNYASTDTIVFTVSAGTAPTATLSLGPSTGTFPSCVAYFQERRVYAGSNNQPDTYWMSQPGTFTNFDSRIPSVAGDAITGTPWSQQVNGIQAMVPMPGGLVVLTGLGAWQVTGSGGSSLNPQAITPSSQQAQPQAYNGCSPTVPPITINYDILYVQAKGSIVRDLSYNFFVNIYTGTDLTILSSHLFTGFKILEWAWAEEPYKIVWCVRDDGTLLSLTYLKEQEIYAWARHDTQGSFISVCTVTEPPVDAPYVVVSRLIQDKWLYYIERMDDREWSSVEDSWCVDAGLSYPMPTPNAILTAAAAQGRAGIGSILNIASGANYSAPIIVLKDPTGSGAAFSFSIGAGGALTLTQTAPGQNYTNPIVTIVDPTGSGYVGQPVIENNILFTASAGVFSSGSVGQVIRMGGGVATIVQYIDAEHVMANITTPIALTIPDIAGVPIPLPAASGDWTMTQPVSVVSGLNHLNGEMVTGIADGQVINPQIVVEGQITLPQPASAITVGLGYIAQMQTMYLDANAGQATMQGRRKNVQAATIRVEASRGIAVGTNQIDASTTPSGTAPPWGNMIIAKDRSNLVGVNAAVPLFTGDIRVNVPGDWKKPGQVAVQQSFPLPASLLAVVSEVSLGDDPSP